MIIPKTSKQIIELHHRVKKAHNKVTEAHNKVTEAHNKVTEQKQCNENIESWMDLIDIDNTYINIDDEAPYNILYRNIIRDEFYGTIDRFCDSLTLFDKYAKNLINHQTYLIKKKIIHTSGFNLYVDEVNIFNNIMRRTISLLNDMITSLNNLFTGKKKQYFIDFIEYLYQFILYLLLTDVFTHINYFKKKIDKKDKNSIAEMKIFIFDIFNISLDILSLFVPQFTVVKKSCNMLENHINKRFSIIQDILDENEHNTCIDNIIRQMLNIQLRTEILTSFKNDISFNNLIKLENDKLVSLTETIQKNYTRLVNNVDTLGDEIIDYRNKKKGIIDRIIQYINFYINC
jgi:hypothetical protein